MQGRKGGPDSLGDSGRKTVSTEVCAHTQRTVALVSGEGLKGSVGVEAALEREQLCQGCFQITHLLSHVGRLLSLLPAFQLSSVVWFSRGRRGVVKVNPSTLSPTWT